MIRSSRLSRRRKTTLASCKASSSSQSAFSTKTRSCWTHSSSKLGRRGSFSARTSRSRAATTLPDKCSTWMESSWHPTQNQDSMTSTTNGKRPKIRTLLAWRKTKTTDTRRVEELSLWTRPSNYGARMKHSSLNSRMKKEINMNLLTTWMTTRQNLTRLLNPTQEMTASL